MIRVLLDGKDRLKDRLQELCSLSRICTDLALTWPDIVAKQFAGFHFSPKQGLANLSTRDSGSLNGLRRAWGYVRRNTVPI